MNQIYYYQMNQLEIQIQEQQVRIKKVEFNIVSVMDLILNINRMGPRGEGEEFGTTCVMVTHNPELECYADRILYVQDGMFIRQAINEVQTAIKEDEYTKFLHNENN